MGGFFGCVSTEECSRDLYYGTDYHSHLGTKRGGMAVLNSHGFARSIHNIQNDYFRSKFEGDLLKLKGNKGIGVISDYDPQPLIISSHLGTFALVMVGKINNLAELTARAFDKKLHFSEMSGGEVSPTEMVGMLIAEAGSFQEGIVNAQQTIKGSCSMLILTEAGIFAARDRLGRTPIVLGRKQGAIAAASESCAFPNLGYELERDLGPAEIVWMTADGL